MPGHIIGIEASLSFILESPNPMTYTKRDWGHVEQALKGLKGKKLGKHTIREVSISGMRPTAAAISTHFHDEKGRATGPKIAPSRS